MPAGAPPAACVLLSPNPVQQPTGTLTEVPLLSARHLVKPAGQKCCLAAIHHHHQAFITPALSSFIEFIRPVFRQARPATGLCTQTLADRKASLTPITLELASVCGGSLVTAPLAVNQFLPGYRLSAPRSLSYYNAAVCSSAGPVWTGPARPHGYVVTTPTPCSRCSHPPAPQPDPFSLLTVCGGDLPPQVSRTFFSSVSCQSHSSLTRALIPCSSAAPLPLTHWLFLCWTQNQAQIVLI